jgi:hypothetical protein
MVTHDADDNFDDDDTCGNNDHCDDGLERVAVVSNADNITRLSSTQQAIHGETALHVAFASDKAHCVRYLLSAGARMDASDRCVSFSRLKIEQLIISLTVRSNAGFNCCRGAWLGHP